VELFITNQEVWDFFWAARSWGWEAACAMMPIPEEEEERWVFFMKFRVLDRVVSRVTLELQEEERKRWEREAVKKRVDKAWD
jgi:hypothetical protein